MTKALKKNRPSFIAPPCNPMGKSRPEQAKDMKKNASDMLSYAMEISQLPNREAL